MSKITRKHIPVGIDAQGKLVDVSMDAANGLIAGVPRMGKSVFMYVVAAGLCQLEHECVIILDPKGTDFMPFRERAVVISDLEEMSALLRLLCDEMDSRFKWLIAHDMTKFDSDDFTDENPHISIVIDEFAEVAASGASREEKKADEERVLYLRRLIQKGAASGISVVLATQRSSTNIIPADLRDLFAGFRVSFKAATPTSVDMVFYSGANLDAPAHLLPQSAKGIGYIQQDGEFRLFKSFMIERDDCYQVSRDTAYLKPSPAFLDKWRDACNSDDGSFDADEGSGRPFDRGSHRDDMADGFSRRPRSAYRSDPPIADQHRSSYRRSASSDRADVESELFSRDERARSNAFNKAWNDLDNRMNSAMHSSSDMSPEEADRIRRQMRDLFNNR